MKFGVKALVDVDGEQVYAPAITTYKGRGAVGADAVGAHRADEGHLHDARRSRAQNDTDVARITVAMKPMILWLWVGGALMAVGTVLAAFPGRRRRAIDPVSAGVPDAATGAVSAPASGDPEPDLEVSTHG